MAVCVCRGVAGLPAPDRAEAGRSLAVLGDTRPEVLTLEAMRFCFVPAGPFLTRDSAELTDLDYDYWISEFPITNAQYAEFVAEDGYLDERWWDADAPEDGWTEEGFQGFGDSAPRQAPVLFRSPFHLSNHPVVGVSWHEAVAFTRWLQDKWRRAQILPPALGLRLPHQTEWEKAVKGGLRIPRVIPSPSRPGSPEACDPVANPNPQREFPWEGEFKADKANCEETGIEATSAVGCFPLGISPYGCLEMSGNVWEWTADVPPGGVRVIRGGSFTNPAGRARASFRFRRDPRFRIVVLGFRVVLPPPRGLEARRV